MRSCAPLDATYDGEIGDFATARLWRAYCLSHMVAKGMSAGRRVTFRLREIPAHLPGTCAMFVAAGIELPSFLQPIERLGYSNAKGFQLFRWSGDAAGVCVERRCCRDA
jgi:hypothetical protein